MSTLKTATKKRKRAKKRSLDTAGYNRFWEMREQGAGISDEGNIVRKQKKVFRCMCCGSTTGCKGKDYGGEPDTSKCTPECQADFNATRASSRVTDEFRDNYQETFGHA